MDFRSTNTKYVHFGGDIVSNVDDGSSYGVHITGGSTGGIIQAAGDTTNIGIIVRGKGSGVTQVGSTASPVLLGGSTSGVSMMQTSRIQFTVPALSSAGAAGSVAQSTLTMAGATTNAFYIVQQRVSYNSTVDPGIYVTGHSSAANELTLTFWNHSDSTISGSTSSAYLLRIGF